VVLFTLKIGMFTNLKSKKNEQNETSKKMNKMKHLKKINEIFGMEVSDKLMNLANEISTYLNSKGFNIVTSQGVIINNRNIISLNHYFSDGEYNSGIKLNFELSKKSIKYIGMGKFGFRDKKYETTENLNTINKIVKEVENYTGNL